MYLYLDLHVNYMRKWKRNWYVYNILNCIISRNIFARESNAYPAPYLFRVHWNLMTDHIMKYNYYLHSNIFSFVKNIV